MTCYSGIGFIACQLYSLLLATETLECLKTTFSSISVSDLAATDLSEQLDSFLITGYSIPVDTASNLTARSRPSRINRFCCREYVAQLKGGCDLRSRSASTCLLAGGNWCSGYHTVWSWWALRSLKSATLSLDLRSRPHNSLPPCRSLPNH